MGTNRNKKPTCPACGGPINLSVWSVNGHDSSIGAGGSLLSGSSETFTYVCKTRADICRISVDLFQYYTGDFLRCRGGWRKALRAFYKYVEFSVDNEILMFRLRANSNEYGEIGDEARNLFIKPALIAAENRQAANLS